MPTQEEILAAQAREAAGAAAAAQANAAYRNNTNPILPTMGSSGLTQAEVQDAANEAAKHAAAFHTEDYYGFNYADLANTPLSQIASRYGTNAADMVQGHYTENPTAKFQEINRLYNDRVGVTATGGGEGAGYKQGSFVPTVLAGEGGFTGRAADYKAAWAPLQQSKYGMESLVERTDVVPTRDLSTAATDSGGSGRMETWGGRTFYVPYGERTQQELLETKAVYDPEGGRVGFYQVPRSIYESKGGFQRKYGWETASGSTGALQSGMFSIERPLTPDVRTQWAPGNYAKSADVVEAQEVRWNPQAYSRMGAEAYGGTVTKMDNRTLAPGTPMGRYAPETGNMANLVNPYGVNRPKSELQATEPWKIEMGSPVLQTMGGSGIRGTTLAPAGEGEYAKVGVDLSGRPHDGGMVGREATTTGLQRPFVSTSMAPIETRMENPRGELFGMYIPGVSEGVAFFEPKSMVSISEKRTPTESVTTFGAPYTVGDTTYYPSTTTSGEAIVTTETSTPIPGTSGYDMFNQKTREALHLPSVEVGEKGLEIASAFNPLSTGFIGIRAGKEVAFGTMDFIGVNASEARKGNTEIVNTTDVYKGQYKSFYEQPALVVGSYAAGAVFGTVFKSVEGVGGAVRSRLAPKIIGGGQTARAVEMYGSGAWKAAQVGMGGLYAADLSSRATKGFTDLSPGSVSPRARAMLVQEVYPMTVGFGAPTRAAKTIRTGFVESEKAYQQALMAGKGEPGLKLNVEPVPIKPTKPVKIFDPLTGKVAKTLPVNTPLTYQKIPNTQKNYIGAGWGASEPTTTGRFDWYVKQPITKAVSRPINIARNDYRAFVMEAGEKIPVVQIRKPGVTDYITYKMGGGEYRPAIAPEPVTPINQYTVQSPELSRIAYGKQRPVITIMGEKFGVGKTPQQVTPTLRTSDSIVYEGGKWLKVSREPIGDVSPGLSQKAYGKQKTIFDSSYKVMQEPHQYSRYVSEKTSNAMSRVYSTEPINIRVKSYLQEHPSQFMENLRISARYPEQEVQNINRASKVRLGDMFAGTPRQRGTSTLNIWEKQPSAIISRTTPYPESKPVETTNKNGMVSLSRVETISRGPTPSMQTLETFRGMPVWPSGPSPSSVTRQRYRIEEETEYYRLPPGMISPGQKQETIQSVMSIPASATIFSTITAMNPMSITKQEQVTYSKQPMAQEHRQRVEPQLEFKFTASQDRFSRSDIFSGQKLETRVIVEPKFDIGQRQDQRQGQKQIQTSGGSWIRQWEKLPDQPIPHKIPGGMLPGGGGGGGYRGNLGVTTWRRNNLVADMPYLAKGMGGMDLSAGLYNDFSTPKARRKSKRRKK